MRNIFTVALLFVLGSTIAWSQSIVNFPIPSDSGPAGYAIFNPGTAVASVTFTAFSAALDGAQLASVTVTVPAGGQMAKLGTELFPGASNPQGGLRGWVQATSATSGLLGMESTGNFSTGVDAINGAVPSSDQILPVSGTTRIFAGNPGDSALTVTIKAYDANGTQVGSTITKRLQAKSLYDSQAQDGILFGTNQSPLFAAVEHVRISATAQVVASAILSTTILPNALDAAAVNGTDVAGAQTVLNFPHVVNGPLGGLNYVSLVGVTNPTASQQTLTLTFNPDSGSPQSMQATVKPNGSLQGTIRDLFGLPSGYQSGWLQVGGAAQLIGYVAFGETTGGGIDLVPVQPTAQTTLLFGQLAELAPWYTGVALLNTSTTDATVEVYAMSTDGSLIGDPQDFSVGHFTLPAKTRTARLISQFIPATDTRSTDGGFMFVRTTNNVPLFGMVLFSLRSGAALANVAAEGLPQGITYSPPTRQPSARDFALITLPPLDPSFLQNTISPDRPIMAVSTPSFELQYDPTPTTFVYPCDEHITRWITVKNNGSYLKLFIDGSITGPNGYSITFQDDPPFPQPSFIYLQPGESQRIWIVLNWSQMDQSFWTDGAIYDYPINISVSPDCCVSRDQFPEYTQRVTLHNTVSVLLAGMHPPSNLPQPYNNATISGTVYDAATGKPIEHAQVTLITTNVPPTFKPFTDSTGAFSIHITAFKEALKDIWTKYGVTVQASGYADFCTIVAPHEGDDIRIKAPMTPAVGTTTSYSITKKFDGILNQYGAEGSADGKYVAFSPFHSIVPPGVDAQSYLASAQLYFFNTDGTLLWQFPLYGEVPDVAVSDDGSFVATARVDLTRSDNGVYLLDNAGHIVWFVGNLGNQNRYLEFRISHDNKYFAIGDLDGNIYLLDIASQTVVWHRFVNGQLRELKFDSDNATLYAGSGDGYLYALKMDGTVVWRTYIGAWATTFSSSPHYILVSGKVGYFESLLDKATGRILWEYPIGACPLVSIIAPDESYMLISGSANQKTLILDRNGALLYCDEGGGLGFVTDDSAYILSTGDESAPNDYGSIWIKVIDRAGHELWKISNVDTTIDRGPMEGYSWMSKDGKKMIVATGNWIYFLSGSLPSSK